jgi:hypothetical protein
MQVRRLEIEFGMVFARLGGLGKSSISEAGRLVAMTVSAAGAVPD